jgi:tetratricopeptide (TPR) repeat protein
MAVPFLYRACGIAAEIEREDVLGVTLFNLSNTLGLIGRLRNSEGEGRQALVIARHLADHFTELSALRRLGVTFGARGLLKHAKIALGRSSQILGRSESLNDSLLAQLELWQGEFDSAASLTRRAWETAELENRQRNSIYASRRWGQAALGLDDLVASDELLHFALTRSRAVGLIDEELQALTALAQLRRHQRGLKSARELLNDVWELAERGPYPLVHADALNVLAQIERDEGNKEAAIEAATKAYRLAWCDGPPFAYHWGLEKAKRHLKELGAPEPEMPRFDESKFEPMPEVEINPHDDFYVDEESIS